MTTTHQQIGYESRSSLSEGTESERDGERGRLSEGERGREGGGEERR